MKSVMYQAISIHLFDFFYIKNTNGIFKTKILHPGNCLSIKENNLINCNEDNLTHFIVDMFANINEIQLELCEFKTMNQNIYRLYNDYHLVKIH